MPRRKRILVIGTAPKYLIDSTLAGLDSSATDLFLLLPERDRGCFEDRKKCFFKGGFHPLFLPLMKTMAAFRPDEVIIVCGMTYDHDNVVKAVSYYRHFKNFDLKITVRDRKENPPQMDRPGLLREPLRFVALGAIALTIKALSGFVRIRVGEMFASRLGHLAMESEIYLCEKELGRHENCFDLFYFKDNEISNQVLAEMVSARLRVNYGYRHILDAIRRFHLTSEHEILLNTRKLAFVRDSECLMQQTESHLEFPSKDTNKGRKGLTELGLDPDRPHVCIFGRDSAYLQEAIPENNDADMQEIRDMRIETFKPGAEYLLDEGYNVLRMGSIVKAPLQITHPGFIDYATSGKRTEFMDVFISSSCKFFIGVQSGLMHIPMIFRIPCLCVNVVRLEIIHSCSPEDLALFKLLWSVKEKRFLTVEEQLKSGMSRWRLEMFANSGIEAVDNTEDEILEATKEINARVNGTWTETEEDRDLQKKFRSYFTPSYLNSSYRTPVSSYFLRKHKKILF
ncbi:TIGR04372 family glycosyltransferase [Maridesulfovibrio sp.]|uniref:TIGR04372 family glycosyltransferase n=1 Tax=Maridesulfovibrio sp. TaxID=2795000 RepID=UPI002A18AB02|nr:TIGR04372 family glycosyltransferase [Maridesulfovibrio sp.]